MKILALLFVVIALALGVGSCLGDTKNLLSNNQPLCPDWAIPEYGTVCESLNLDVTPDDLIALVEWQIGMIQLNNSYIDNVYGVQFFTSEGSLIGPKDMEQGVFYSFKKTTATASFHIWPNQNYGPLSPDTHILLAKP
jgi:hypothetical protein